ncbi:hypothetical protein DIPPA_64855, partial [Diplonema papillatum]
MGRSVALYGVALLFVAAQQASAACPQVTDITALCAAFASDTCAVWAGTGEGEQKLPAKCIAKQDFELSCTSASDTIDCNAGGFGVGDSSNKDVTLAILRCKLKGSAKMTSGFSGTGRNIVLNLEDTSVDGQLVFTSLTKVAMKNVNVTGTVASASSLSFLNVERATANDVFIKCAHPIASLPVYGAGILLSRSIVESETLNVEGCSARSYGGGIYVSSQSTLNMNGTTEIRDCQADRGAGLAVAASVVNVRGVLNIQDSISKSGGGAVYAASSTLDANVVTAERCNTTSGSGGA